MIFLNQCEVFYSLLLTLSLRQKTPCYVTEIRPPSQCSLVSNWDSSANRMTYKTGKPKMYSKKKRHAKIFEVILTYPLCVFVTGKLVHLRLKIDYSEFCS